MKHNPETIALAMDYAAVMEACAAYVAVKAPAVLDPKSAYRLLRPVMRAATSGDSQETFFTLLLDTKNKLIGAPVECCRGLLDQCLVHPREVFREAVMHSAASLILAHNHPSGDPTPTKEDCDITRRLIEAGNILGIRVLDHLIVGKPSPTSPGYVSLREKNLVSFDWNHTFHAAGRPRRECARSPHGKPRTPRAQTEITARRDSPKRDERKDQRP